MNLSKFEKLIYVGCPWLFGMVLVINGILLAQANPNKIHGLLLICSGLISMSLFCVAALLAKVVNKK